MQKLIYLIILSDKIIPTTTQDINHVEQNFLMLINITVIPEIFNIIMGLDPFGHPALLVTTLHIPKFLEPCRRIEWSARSIQPSVTHLSHPAFTATRPHALMHMNPCINSERDVHARDETLRLSCDRYRAAKVTA